MSWVLVFLAGYYVCVGVQRQLGNTDLEYETPQPEFNPPLEPTTYIPITLPTVTQVSRRVPPVGPCLPTARCSTRLPLTKTAMTLSDYIATSFNSSSSHRTQFSMANVKASSSIRSITSVHTLTTNSHYQPTSTATIITQRPPVPT